MPRSVRIAIAATSVIGFLGAVGLVLAIVDISHVIGVVSDVIVLHDTYFVRSGPGDAAGSGMLVAGAILAMRGLVRRHPLARRATFAVALVASCLIGILGLYALALVRPGSWGELALSSRFPLLASPFAVLAWSLSRPSAKAWFTTR